MNLREISHKIVFTGCPIRWDTEFPDDAYDPRGASFVLTRGGRVLYEGRTTVPVKLDLRDIAQAYTQYLPEAKNGLSLEQILSAADLDAMKIDISVEYDGYSDGCSFIPLPGKLPAYYTDFDAEDHIGDVLLRSNDNYLLTQIRDGWRFAIKETELAPMYFIRNNETPCRIEAYSKDNDGIVVGNVTKGVYAIDFAAIRRQFIEIHDVLPSVITIYTGGRLSFTCEIMPGGIVEDSLLVKYRNCFGCFEVIELNGEQKINLSGEFLPEDYKMFNPITGRMERHRDGGDLSELLTIQATIKERDDALPITEMVQSEEVYLLCDNKEHPVIPKMEDAEWVIRRIAPTTVPIKFVFAKSGVTPWGDMRQSKTPRQRPRAFADNFNDKFN